MEPRCGTPHSYQQMLGVWSDEEMALALQRLLRGCLERRRLHQSAAAAMVFRHVRIVKIVHPSVIA